MNDYDKELGAKIRGWRQARRISLRDLARLSGLSAGAVSQIERGLSSPSLKAIRKISAALGVPVAWFFSAEGVRDKTSGLIVREAERRLLKLGDFGVAKYLLTPYAPGHLETLLVRIDPHGTTGDEFFTHPGEETGTVLKGDFRLWIEDEIYEMSAGDTYRFEATRPHKFDNPSDGVTEVLMTISPPFYCFQPAVDAADTVADSTRTTGPAARRTAFKQGEWK